MTKQFIPLSHDAPDILVATGGPFREDVAYMKADMLDDILEYIEVSEFQWDSESGYARDLDEIIADNNMPDIYYKLLDIKNSLSGQNGPAAKGKP